MKVIASTVFGIVVLIATFFVFKWLLMLTGIPQMHPAILLPLVALSIILATMLAAEMEQG